MDDLQAVDAKVPGQGIQFPRIHVRRHPVVFGIGLDLFAGRDEGHEGAGRFQVGVDIPGAHPEMGGSLENIPPAFPERLFQGVLRDFPGTELITSMACSHGLAAGNGNSGVPGVSEDSR